MATYRVEVVRTAYRIAEIEIEANSIEEANALALEKAGDTMFRTEHDYDYEVNSVVEVDESNVQ
jgi:hypothetical protein